MITTKLISTHLKSFIKEHEITQMKHICEAAKNLLLNNVKDNNPYTGWVNFVQNYDKKEFSLIIDTAEKIKKNSDVFIVIGIGGSYLGAKAGIEFLSHSFYNNLDKNERQSPEIYFVGNNLSATYINDLISIIEKKDFSINVISKSGTTTEPAIAFRIFKQLLEKKYGKTEANKRIYVTTDKTTGALRTLSNLEQYTSFIVPDNIGGRYSVLTSVGLLPIAVSGGNINKIIQGACNMMENLTSTPFEYNIALQYATYRNILLRRGKNIEILANFEPRLHYFIEWWKQLFGESEGKDGRGIFPAAADYSTDLHSMGQFVQDGSRNLFETVIQIENPILDMKIPYDEKNLDELNYLAGKTLKFVNDSSMFGAAIAHEDGNVPNIRIIANTFNEETLGELFYFFEFSCAISGYINGINPFNQDGVENYKKNMFSLLGKNGYEKIKDSISKKLN